MDSLAMKNAFRFTPPVPTFKWSFVLTTSLQWLERNATGYTVRFTSII
jgi:hypothetical protein